MYEFIQFLSQVTHVLHLVTASPTIYVNEVTDGDGDGGIIILNGSSFEPGCFDGDMVDGSWVGALLIDWYQDGTYYVGEDLMDPNQYALRTMQPRADWL